MDTNPFEDGIRVPDTLVKQARELLPKQPTEDRILTLSESTNGSIVLHNINRRIQTNAKVLLLGDINMSNALYRQFETIIITIMKHLNITRDIKKALDTTVDKDLLPKRMIENIGDKDVTVLDLINTLVAYNIPLYRIEMILDNALFTFRQANNYYNANTGKTLDMKEITYLKYHNYFFELIKTLKTKQEQATLKEILSGPKYRKALDYFLGTRAKNKEFLDIDVNGEIVFAPDDTEDLGDILRVDKLYVQERVSELQTLSGDVINYDVYTHAEDVEKLLFEELLQELNLYHTQSKNTIDDIINEIINEFTILKNIYKNKLEQKQNMKQNRAVKKV